MGNFDAEYDAMIRAAMQKKYAELYALKADGVEVVARLDYDVKQPLSKIELGPADCRMVLYYDQSVDGDFERTVERALNQIIETREKMKTAGLIKRGKEEA